MYSRICKKCDRPFETEKRNKTICDSCMLGAEDSIFHCKYCGKPIAYNNTFCSYSCNSKYNLSQYNPYTDGAVMKPSRDEFKEKMKDEAYRNEILEKSRSTKLFKYGDKSYHNIEQMKATNLARYGVECIFASTDDSINGRGTIKKLMQNVDFRDAVVSKRKTSLLKSHGVDIIFKDTDYIKACKANKSGSLEKSYQIGLERSKEACLKKYGVEFYTQTDEYKLRAEETRKKHTKDFGYLQPTQQTFSDEFKDMLYDRDKSVQFLGNKLYTINDLAQKFDCSITAVVHWIKRLNLKDSIQFYCGSRYEKELFSVFSKYNFKPHCKILDGKEIDLYNDVLKVGIEFNGDYWHSDINKPKSYHYDKSLLAQKQGIRLIHIYEYEWNDIRIRPIIESLIRIACNDTLSRIYARECKIRQITNSEAKVFNNKNHIQGHRNAQVTYGLFYKNELVQLMSFSFDRKKDWWEIIRGCPGSNNIVVGGVSKLFSHFIRDYSPKRIFSYCDFNKFDGTGYEKLGMKFVGYTGPDRTWLINGNAVKRQPAKHKELKELADASIWGAGSKKYLLEIN